MTDHKLFGAENGRVTAGHHDEGSLIAIHVTAKQPPAALLATLSASAARALAAHLLQLAGELDGAPVVWAGADGAGGQGVWAGANEAEKKK
jgi:hypothetical protein